MAKKKLRYTHRGRPSGHKTYEFVNSEGKVVRLPGSMTIVDMVRLGITPHIGRKGDPPTQTIFVPHPYRPPVAKCADCGEEREIVGQSTMCGPCRSKYIYEDEDPPEPELYA